MAKKGISSLEVAALVQELRFLIRGKISQIYHQENEEMLFQIHVPNRGKQLLKIIPGKFLCLIPLKEETPLRPSGFCMQLRKYLDNAFIKNFSQRDSERIVFFELERGETFYLIIELFSKGNVVLTDASYQIIGVLERQIWKDRVVKPGEKYLFPATGINWKTMTEKELATILRKSEKRNVATSLATEIGLGGVYAEEACTRAGVDKGQEPKTISSEEVRLLGKTIHSFVDLIETPKGYFYPEDITPFPLQGKSEIRVVESYNEAISTLNPYQKKSPYDQRIKTLERMLEAQDEAILNQQEKIGQATQKGETIYQKYAPLHQLLEIVKELRKNREWKDVALELKKEKKIKSIDLKSKKILIDL